MCPFFRVNFPLRSVKHYICVVINLSFHNHISYLRALMRHMSLENADRLFVFVFSLLLCVFAFFHLNQQRK